MCPSGYSPSVGTMPKKVVSNSWSSLSVTPKLKSVRGKVTLMLLPPSTNTFFTLLSRITELTRSGYCRCFGSDRTPGVAPQGVFRSRTVSTTVAKWFVPIARGTVDKVYRFGPLRDA
jgi:hypothetical protein